MNPLNLLAVTTDAWLVALVETSLRLSVILLVAGAIAFVLRRSSANLRHLVWALALGGVLMLPVGASYLPAVHLPMPRPLQVFARPAAETATTERPSEILSPAVSRMGPLAGGAAENLENAVVLTAVPAAKTTRTAALAVSDAARPPSAATAPARADRRDPSRFGMAPSWQQAVIGLWITGLVILLLRIGVGLAAAHRIGRRAERPRDDEWERLAVELRRRIGLTRAVRILSSGHTSVPMTWGWARPVVLVPEAGATWSTARKRVVLLHELSHVKRYDCASQLVAHVACAVYWFNPLVWLAARALRVEREHACDEAVVRDGTQASSYADHLLEIARAHQGARWSSLAAVAMARRSQLEGRLLSILDGGQRRRPSRQAVLALGTVMMGLILMSTLVTPTTHAAAPMEAGAVTALAATRTEVFPEGVASQVPTGPGVLAAQQPPAPVAPQTPAVDEQRRLADEQARRVLELELETRALATQDSVRREQAERAERDVVELEQRLVEIRQRVGRDVIIEEREVQRAVERAQRAAERAQVLAGRDLNLDVDLDLDGLFYGVRIAEEVRERYNVALERFAIQRRVGVERRPLDPRVVELFLESLTDEDAEVRERAAWGLGRNRVEMAVGPLSNTLRDETPEVRERAAWALGMIRSPAAVPGLGAALDDTEPSVRTEIVEALGLIRDASAVEPLVGALRDSEPRVRREAAESLGRIRDGGAVDGLVAALGDAEPTVVEHAAEALGMLRDARAVEGLVGALRHQDPDVVEAAAEALGRIRSGEAIDGLVATLRTTEGDVAEEIVEALGRIGGDRALDALIEVTGDASPAVRKAVIEALSGRRWSSNTTPHPNPNPSPTR